MLSLQELYETRRKRYYTAMRNGKPDMVPIRPFVAEFTAKYAGFTCQEVTQDYRKAFAAVLKCVEDFDWDAVVGNMVYVFAGIPQAMNLSYYAFPGVEVPPNVGFQYLEPSEEKAFMRPEEYDLLTEDPTGYLFNVWFPRVSRDAVPMGEPVTFQNNLAYLKGGMAMLDYFTALGKQNEALKAKGVVSAICGILKAPLDILADKLRGYYGLARDLVERPKQVLKACEALMPHLFKVALLSADPEKELPIAMWMHRSCVPLISPEHFENIYWPTIKPILEELWREGHQVLMYAEGNWDYHLETFRELPPGSIIYHVDRGDLFQAHRVLKDRFALSGGFPNDLLTFASPPEIREYCRKILREIAQDGGYIMDAGAIIQNDASIENVKALTEATREYGQY